MPCTWYTLNKGFAFVREKKKYLTNSRSNDQTPIFKFCTYLF